ncbi:hypothetical protein Peur_025134 [Populus x canadensis]
MIVVEVVSDVSKDLVPSVCAALPPTAPGNREEENERDRAEGQGKENRETSRERSKQIEIKKKNTGRKEKTEMKGKELQEKRQIERKKRGRTRRTKRKTNEKEKIEVQSMMLPSLLPDYLLALSRAIVLTWCNLALMDCLLMASPLVCVAGISLCPRALCFDPVSFSCFMFNVWIIVVFAVSAGAWHVTD